MVALISPWFVGLACIGAVALIWTIASVVVQFMLVQLNFNSPFFLTFISNSLFTLYLPIWKCMVYIKWTSAEFTPMTTDINLSLFPLFLHPIVKCANKVVNYVWRLQSVNRFALVNDIEDRELDILERTGNALHSTAHRPANSRHSGNSGRSSSAKSSDVIVYESIPNVNDHSATATADTDTPPLPPPPLLITHKEHLIIGLIISPVWFAANCAYYYTLLLTSISSSTILSNLSGVVTLLLSWWAGLDCITPGKVAGIALSFLGVCVIATQDDRYLQRSNSNSSNNTGALAYNSSTANSTSHSPPPSSGEDVSAHLSVAALLLGDLCALLGAIGYGVYCTLMRQLLPTDGEVSMPLILGYIGLWNVFLLGPVAVGLLCTDIQSVAGLTGGVLLILVINGILDNVVSDYLWARGVLLTSATVATVGMSVTIPLALITDWLLHSTVPNWYQVVSAALIVTGFVLVNVYHSK